MDLIKEFLFKTGVGIKEFIKATLISSLVSFIVCLIALAMAKVPYYGLIALGLAVLDLIPVLGSGIVLIPWAIISFIAGDTKLVITLIILFVATFLIDQRAYNTW